MQLAQHAWKLLAWHMEERGIGENAVEVASGKLQREEILFPYFAAAVLACHGDERRGAVETNRLVP